MKDKKHCPLCQGVGSYYVERDLHKSGGTVPCYYDPDIPRKPLLLKSIDWKFD